MKNYIITSLILFFMIIFSCDKKEQPLVPQQLTIDELNKLGWNHFSINEFEDAISYFNQSLTKDSTNVSAAVGKGWTLLLQDDNAENATDIEFYFLKGELDATWKNDARCGFVVFRYVNAQYVEIENLVDLILAENPGYFFQYKPEIDWHDLLLIKAQAFFFIEEYVHAWYAVSQLTSVYALDPDDYRTWKVNGVTYFSFEAALSKVIEILSDIYKD